MAARTLKAKDPKEAVPSKPKILVFGKPGVGKTWASMDFPSVYYIDTEGGANLDHYTDKLKKAGGKYLGPEDGSNDFDTVLEEIITLATVKHSFRTLVIDSYSKLFNTQVAVDYDKMETAGRDMDKTFGAEKKGAIAFTRQMVRWFEKLDMNVILICHEKAMWKDGKEIGQTFDGWDKLEYELHLALQITKQGNARKALVTKSRLVQFPDASRFDWSYENFAAKYGREVIEAAAVPVRMADDEQVRQYLALLEIVKVDPTIMEKWEKNCPNVSELDYDGMQKRLAYLMSRMPKSEGAAA
jgi:hypothetical protein